MEENVRREEKNRMRKQIYRLFLTILPFLIGIVVSNPVYAMSNEEKELFDMLGADYTLDENGNFEAFIADENQPRFTVEQKKLFLQKYEGQVNVGNYTVIAGAGETEGSANIWIQDKSGNLLFVVDNCSVLGDSTVYINANGDFIALHYKDSSSENVKTYAEGNVNLGEYGYNPITEYERKEDGTYQIIKKQTGDEFYKYDENGNVIRREDHKTGIIYDGQNNPIAKKINTTDSAGLYSSVPYDVAEEIQQLVDKNNGSFNVYYEKTNSYITMPEIDQLLYESGMAQYLGMTLEEYRKKYDAYKDYTSKVDYICPEIMEDIFETEGKNVWNTWEAIDENEIPSSVSKTAIVEELTNLINNYRVENGLNQLDMSDSLLQRVATLRAEEATYLMDSSHSRPMAGKAPQSFQVGENIAKLSLIQAKSSQEIAQMMFEAWKKSEGHNANMLNGNYKEAAFGVAFVKEGDKLAIYVSNDFSLYEDYQNEVSDTVKRRIEIGAQTPENIGSLENYYNRLYDESVFKPQDTDKAESTETSEAVTATEGGNEYGLQVLDENGNRFVLPNGAEWTQVETSLTDTPVAWGPDGTEYSALEGEIRFFCTDGQAYHIYVCAEMIDSNPNDSSVEYYLNHYTGNTIKLKQSQSQTVDSKFPGGYTVNVASRNCYYIENGEKVVLDFGF